MDLFVVNRYYGDETSHFLVENSSSSHEKEIILEPDVHKVKKKKDVNTSIDTNTNGSHGITSSCDSVLSSSKKRRKAEKPDQIDTSVVAPDVHKVKKKKDGNTSLDTNTSGSHSITSSCDSVLSSSKKRRKAEKSDQIDTSIGQSSVDEQSKEKKDKQSMAVSDIEPEVISEVGHEKESKKKKKKTKELVLSSLCINTDQSTKKKTDKSIKRNDNSLPETTLGTKDNVLETEKNNKTAADSKNSTSESISEEVTKKRKPKFRQRGRYKDRPKAAEPKTENDMKESEEKAVEEMESSDSERENSQDLGGFQVIGNHDFQKKKQVKRVLPDWLAKPTVISVDLKNLKTKIEDVEGLDAHFKKKLRKQKISRFFPVQSELIPFLIKQRSRRTMFWAGDVCVSAPTGSGKTLAFVLPILQLLQYRVVPRIRALVVLPTQDLASQVFSVFQTYARCTKLQVTLTVGASHIQDEQKRMLQWDVTKQKYVSLVDIVVTTPGRLVDHLTNSPGFDLSALKFLVVDEADRMIDNNDCNWLLHINKHINYQGLNSAPPLCLHTFLTYPSRPQRLLFSATLSHDPEKLHQLGLFQPKLFTCVVDATGANLSTADESSNFIGKFTTPAELTEKFTVTRNMLKPLLVYQLIKKYGWKGVLVFVNTAQGAHRLARLLQLIEKVASKNTSDTQLNIAEVYSDLKLKQRNKIIQDFRQRKIHVVVASDNLARGIDVENIDVVINYEAPDNIKKYIHRIGRTARGGRQGTSVTLVNIHEKNAFLKMLASVGKQNVKDLECSEEELETLEHVYAKALEKLKKNVEREGEMTLKIAKAQKKGKIIKKKSSLLDGTKKTSDAKKQKKHTTVNKKTKDNENKTTTTDKENKTTKDKENKTTKDKENKTTKDKENKTTTTDKEKAENSAIKINATPKSPKKVKRTEMKNNQLLASTSGQSKVKRKEIKKVVKKNGKAGKKQMKTHKKHKKDTSNTNGVKAVKMTHGAKDVKMTRNLKLKLKKKLKKQVSKNQGKD